eukprot:4902147-Alexandrium_andersonii.AAC.1
MSLKLLEVARSCSKLLEAAKSRSKLREAALTAACSALAPLSLVPDAPPDVPTPERPRRKKLLRRAPEALFGWG